MRDLFKLLAVMALSLSLPVLARADDRSQVLLVRAERLAAEGKCGEVLALLDGASDPALLRLRGNCEIELGRYVDAIRTLDGVAQASPGLEDVDLMRGVAYYHAGDLESAGRALEAARANTRREAELELYTGLVLLQGSRTREAALALERARRADADTVEPAASYYAALAWQAERDRDRALAALDRVKQRDPDGPWAEQADAALREERGPRWWASIGAGAEYDSNVVLRASDTPLPSDDDDFRGVWSLSGGLRVLDSEDWSGGVLGSYSGSAHLDETEFDTHYPSIGGWLDRRIAEHTLARIRYDYGYAWVDYESFLSTHQPVASLIHDWESGHGTTELYTGYEHNAFLFRLFDVPDGVGGPGSACAAPGLLCGPAGLNEAGYRDRDGQGVKAGLEHRLPIGDTSAIARAGYRYTRYWSEGKEWDRDQHRVNLGLGMLLWWDIAMDLDGTYAYQPHRNPSSFPDPDDQAAAAAAMPTPVVPALSSRDRKDHVWTAGASFEKSISEHVGLSARYSYLHSNSNSEFFDYDRHIVGTYVTVYLP